MLNTYKSGRKMKPEELSAILGKLEWEDSKRVLVHIIFLEEENHRLREKLREIERQKKIDDITVNYE